MEQSFKLIQQLVANFKANEAAYLASNYSESQVRSDFIDKFFTALGWDVTHTKQFNPYEQEVKIENKVTMPGTQRRADYAFFVMPNYRDVKFFTEAKKPSRNLSNADDYYQAIRYAWNANTPIAVLTDFEEFHILDCRYKPKITEALKRKIKSFHYSEYADENVFKEIFYLFGRDAVANGSIDKFAGTLPKPKGKKGSGVIIYEALKNVDEAFLEQLDEYRNTLAKAFKKENQELGGEELTEAVQRTIDRLVFIRFLEDKGIEEPQIIGLHENKSAWNSFLAICKRFEPKYNGLIFKPHRILDGNKFNPPDDRDFADICGELADPTSPYDFDKIPISILGSIYERFLGKVVHATAKRVEVQEKPEVRKAGGVYYTPEYIVRYIVNETVGKLLFNDASQKTTSFPNSSIGNPLIDSRQERAGMTDIRFGKTPEEIAKMSFADIACGSGSFLIEVYSVLLEYHDRWYNANKEKAKKEDVFERDGHLHLSLKKKKEILTNNVYGVDIDFQATEVTQLSLYLKLLENVSMNETHQMGMFKETILPNLNNNIVCGNSLIGTDINGLFENERADTLKPMDFEDVFPIVMKRGGFDAVVGNPPYIFTRELISNFEKHYFNRVYNQTQFKLNTYILFIEKGHRLINKAGYLGYIIPNNWMTLETASLFRYFILNDTKNIHIVNSRDKVFQNASVDTSILIFCKTGDKTVHLYELDQGIFNFIHSKSSLKFLETHNYIIGYNPTVSNKKDSFLNKILSDSVLLEEISEVRNGIQAYTVGEGTPRQTQTMKEERVYHSKNKKDSTYKKYVDGVDVDRYKLGWSKQFVKYGNNLSRPRKGEYFSGERILIRQIPGRPPYSILASYVNEDLVNDNNSMIVTQPKNNYSIKYLLGILNSRLISYWFNFTFGKLQRKVFPQFKIKELRIFPIHKIDLADKQDNIKYDKTVKLVEQMLEAKQKLSAAKTDGEVNRLELHCASLDRKIDEAVYELYGLTEEEIKIVEGE